MTTFSKLASDYRFSESLLREALLKGRPPAECARLLRECADALDRLETHAPTSPEEARDQVFFFLNRGIEGNTVHAGGREIDIALTLAARNFSDMPVQANAAEKAPDRSGNLAMTDYVAGSVERVSLIDTAFRYVATSRANADFYGTRPVRIVGSHVAQMIGSTRFETRAKAHLGACFDGVPQSYVHRVDDRIMSCQMKPVRRESGEIDGALVYMLDVTQEFPALVGDAPLV